MMIMKQIQISVNWSLGKGLVGMRQRAQDQGKVSVKATSMRSIVTFLWTHRLLKSISKASMCLRMILYSLSRLYNYPNWFFKKY